MFLSLKKIYLNFINTKFGPYFMMLIFGLLASLALPPFQFYFISALGFIFAFIYINKISSKRRSVFLMMFFYFGFFILSSSWLLHSFINSFTIYIKIMGWISFLGFFFASTIYALPFFILPLFKNVFGKALGFAALFAISEWIRSFIFVGFGYNMLGSMWYDVLPIVQSAALYGVYGLTFFSVLLFLLPYVLFFYRKCLSRIVIPVLLLFSFYVFIVSWGFWRLHFAEESLREDFKVRIIQPDFPPVYKAITELIQKNTQNLRDLTTVKPLDNIDMVFYHETAFRYFISNFYEYRIKEELDGLIPEKGFFVSGMPRLEYVFNQKKQDIDKMLYNSVVGIDSNFELQTKYFKHRLVPFGEYIPQFFKMFLPSVLTAGGSFSFPEDNKNLLIFPDIVKYPSILATICNEDNYAGQLAGFDIKKNADVMLNVANLAWFGDKFVQKQNLAVGVLRAIEEGMPFIRVINNGYSSVISPYGKMISGDVVVVGHDYKTILEEKIDNHIGPFQIGIMDVKVPNRIKYTLYSMTGNYFIISALFILVILLLLFSKKDSVCKTDFDTKSFKNCVLKNRDASNKFLFCFFQSLKEFILFKFNKNKYLFMKLFNYFVIMLFGMFMVLATPPYNLFFPAVVSIMVFYYFYSEKTDSVLDIYLLSFSFFFGYFLIGSLWLTGPMKLAGVHNAFNRYALLFTFLIPFFVAFFTSLPFIFANRKNQICKLLIFAFAFALGEFIRSRSEILTGFPYIYIGAIWIPVKSVLQFASLFGIYGLAFITSLIFAFPVWLFVNFKRLSKKILLYVSAFVLMLFSFIFLWGMFRIPDKVEFNQNLNLRLVQPMKSRRLDLYDMPYLLNDFNKVIDLVNFEKDAKTNLVILAENVVPFNYASDSLLAADKDKFDLLKKITPDNSYLIMGFVGKYVNGSLFFNDATVKHYNMIAVFNSDAKMIMDYKKVHLAPLGEYVPKYLANLFPRKITAGDADIISGKVRNVLFNFEDAEIIPPFVGNLCYEENYSSYITDKDIMNNNKVDWLLNLTDDIWFRDSVLPYQHFDASYLRAVEEGLPYVRVSNDGPTAVLDAYGRLVEGNAKLMEFASDGKWHKISDEKRNKLDYSEIGVLDVKLPLPPEHRTLYSKTGDVLIKYILISGLIIVLLIDLLISNYFKKKYIQILDLFYKVKYGFKQILNARKS